MKFLRPNFVLLPKGIAALFFFIEICMFESCAQDKRRVCLRQTHVHVQALACKVWLLKTSLVHAK